MKQQQGYLPGATRYRTIMSFDKNAIASDCFFAKKSVVEKPGFATAESAWIERKMVPGFLGEGLA